MPHHDEPPRTRTRVLLISGWAGTGKDTAATILGRNAGYRRTAFADPLKRHVSSITGIPLSVFHSWRKDSPLPRFRNRSEYYPSARTPRDLLLLHARDARERDPDIYAREIAEEIHGNPGIHHWTISDWRYQQEFAFLREALPTRDGYDIIRVRVTRPDVTPSADPTEHDLEEETMDVILDNAGNEDDLAATIREKVVSRYGSVGGRASTEPTWLNVE
jgi:hypothetical protein